MKNSFTLKGEGITMRGRNLNARVNPAWTAIITKKWIKYASLNSRFNMVGHCRIQLAHG